jgi:hypothetical protein
VSTWFLSLCMLYYSYVCSSFVACCCFLWVDSNSDPSVVQPVASRYTNYSIPASSLSRYKLCKYLAHRKTMSYTDRLWFYRKSSYKLTSPDRVYAGLWSPRRRTREWSLCKRTVAERAELWELLQLELFMPRISCKQLYCNLSIDLLCADNDAYLMLALYNDGC